MVAVLRCTEPDPPPAGMVAAVDRPGASRFSSWIDHQLPELPWLTSRMKRAVTAGSRIRVSVEPGPVAIGSDQVTPSAEVSIWYCRTKSPVLTPASNTSWSKVCGDPRSSWNQSPGAIPWPVLHRVARSPSIALPAGSSGLLADADT